MRTAELIVSLPVDCRLSHLSEVGELPYGAAVTSGVTVLKEQSERSMKDFTPEDQ